MTTINTLENYTYITIRTWLCLVFLCLVSTPCSCVARRAMLRHASPCFGPSARLVDLLNGGTLLAHHLGLTCVRCQHPVPHEAIASATKAKEQFLLRTDEPGERGRHTSQVYKEQPEIEKRTCMYDLCDSNILFEIPGALLVIP